MVVRVVYGHRENHALEQLSQFLRSRLGKKCNGFSQLDIIS